MGNLTIGVIPLPGIIGRPGHLTYFIAAWPIGRARIAEARQKKKTHRLKRSALTDGIEQEESRSRLIKSDHFVLMLILRFMSFYNLKHSTKPFCSRSTQELVLLTDRTHYCFGVFSPDVHPPNSPFIDSATPR